MKKEMARRARKAYEDNTAARAIGCKVEAKAIMHNNRKNWTSTDITKLTRMYCSGRLTISQIADRLGRSYFATAKRASRLNLTYGQKPLKNWGFNAIYSRRRSTKN